jgi:hypothetical protein
MAWDQLSNLSPDQLAQLSKLANGGSISDGNGGYIGRMGSASSINPMTGESSSGPNTGDNYYHIAGDGNSAGQQYQMYDPTGKQTGNYLTSQDQSGFGTFAKNLAMTVAAVYGAGALGAGGAGAGEAASGTGALNSFDSGAMQAALNGSGGAASAGGAGSGLGTMANLSIDGMTPMTAVPGEMAGLGGGAAEGAAGAGAAGAAAGGGGGGSLGTMGTLTTDGMTAATAVPDAMTGLGGGGLGSLGGYGALLGPAASLAGGLYGASAAKDAAATQAASADKALQLQRDMFNKVIDLNEPFRQGGVAGMNALTTALGVTPGDNSGWAMKDFAPSDLTTDPSYQWRLQQGQQALERSAAAKGGLSSGGFMKDLTNYAQGAASQEYGNAFNRFQTQRSAKLAPLQSLAGVGQSAAGTVGNAAQSYGNNGANLITGAGNATAAGQVGAANAITSALGQGLSQYQNNELMNRLLPQR